MNDKTIITIEVENSNTIKRVFQILQIRDDQLNPQYQSITGVRLGYIVVTKVLFHKLMAAAVDQAQ